MADNAGITLATSSFRKFNKVLNEFNTTTITVVSQLDKVNASFVIMSKVYDTNISVKVRDLANSFKILDRSLAGVRNLNIFDNLAKLGGSELNLDVLSKNAEALEKFINFFAKGIDNTSKIDKNMTFFQKIGTLFGNNKGNGLIKSFSNISINDVRKFQIAQDAISGMTGIINILANINISPEKITVALESLNNLFVAFTGFSNFKRVSNVVKPVLDDLNKTYENISGAKGIFGKLKNAFAGFGATGIRAVFNSIVSLGQPTGMLDRLVKFRPEQIGKFKLFADSIEGTVSSLKRISTISLSAQEMSHISDMVKGITSAFTNLSGFDRVGNIINRITGSKSIGSAIGGVLKELGQAMLPSVIKRISSFPDSAIMGLKRFSQATVHISTALSTFSDIKAIQPEIVLDNLKLLSRVTDYFVGGALFNLISPSGMFGKIVTFFGGGGLVNKIKTTNLQNLTLLSWSLLDFARSFEIITKLNFDSGKVNQFVDSLEHVVSRLIRVGGGAKAFGILGKLSATVSDTVRHITISKLDTKQMEQSGRKMGSSFLLGIRKVMRIASPSKAMQEIGEQSIQGFDKAIVVGLPMILGMGVRVAGAFINGIKQLKNDPFGSIFSFLKRGFNVLSGKVQTETKSMFSRLTDLFRNLSYGSFGFNQIGQAFNNISGAFSAAIDFESGMADVFKTVDLSDLSEEQAQKFVKDFGDEIKYLATSDQSTISGMENAFSSLFNIAAQAGSAGIAKENMSEFIQTIGELTTASDLTADTATTEIASFANITGTTEYRRLGSTIVELGNQFNATESKIVELGQRLAGISSGTQLTEANILGLAASMASVGINAESGGTSMTQFIGDIIKANSTMAGGTVSADQYTASLNRNADALKTQRTEIERDLIAAQDRLNRATTVSARFNAEDAVAKYSGQLATIDKQISDIGNKINSAPLEGVINLVGTGGKELKEFARIAGLTEREFSELWGNEPIRVIQKLIEGFSKMTPEEQVKSFEALGTEGDRMTDMLRRLSGAQEMLNSSIDIANNAWDENIALSKEAQIRNETGRAALNRLKNTARLLGVTFQTLFLDSFKGFADVLHNLGMGLNDFITANGEMIRSVLPKVIKGVAALSALFLATRINLGSLLQVFKLVTSPALVLLKTIIPLVSIIASPIGLIAAFTGLIFVPSLMNDLSDSTSTTSKTFTAMWDAVKDLFSGIFELVDIIGTFLTSMFNVKTEGESAFGSIVVFIQPVISFIQTLADGIQKVVDNLRIIGTGLGFDMGFETDREREINGLLDKRKEVLEKINTLVKPSSEGAGITPAANVDPYKIAAGDTMYGIASRFGISVEDIMTANPYIENPSLIFAGKELNIPLKIVDANGNEIVQTNGTGNSLLGDLFNLEVNAELLAIDETIKALQTAEPAETATSLIDRLSEIKDTDIFKNIFGDDDGALSRAVEQVELIGAAFDKVRSGSEIFVNAFTTLFSGDLSGSIGLFKDAIIEMAAGISDTLGGLFGEAETVVTLPTFAQSRGMSFDKFLEGTTEKTDKFKSNSFFSSITDAIYDIGEALGFLDDIDFTFAIELFDSIKAGISEFATPVFEGAIKTFQESIAPAIENVLKIFSGQGEGGEKLDTSNIPMVLGFLGDIASGILQFLGTVGSVVVVLTGSTIKLIIDLFNGIGGLVNAIKGGQTDIGANLDEFLFQPLINFTKNITVGVLDAVIGFLESITGMDLPSGEEFWGDFVNYFEDAAKRLRIGMLDLSIELNRIAGKPIFQSLVNQRALVGLTDSALKEVTEQLGGVVNLDEIVKFEFQGTEYSGSLSDIITGKLGDISGTLSTKDRSNLKSLADSAFDQFVTTGNSGQLQTTLDIYKLIGEPTFDLDFSAVNFEEKPDLLSDIFQRTLGTSANLNLDFSSLTLGEGSEKTVAQAIIDGAFTFDNIDMTNAATNVGNIIREIANVSIERYKQTGNIAHLDNASNILYEAITDSISLTDQQKTDLNWTLSRELNGLINDFKFSENDRIKNELALAVDSISFIIPDETQKQAGIDIVRGIANGVGENQDFFDTAMTKLGDDGFIKFADSLEIRSPSQKMYDAGKNVVEGLSNGIVDHSTLLTTTIQEKLIKPFETLGQVIYNVGEGIKGMMLLITEVRKDPDGQEVIDASIAKILSGTRKFGGSVNAGGIYEILEDRLPFELYKTQGGKTYFLPNENGNIVSPLGSGNGMLMEKYSNGGNTSNSNTTNITVPVTIESLPAGMTEHEKERFAEQIGAKVKRTIDKDNRNNTLGQKLDRRGLS